MGGDNNERSPLLIPMLARFALSRNHRLAEICTNFLDHRHQLPFADDGKPSRSLCTIA
jgi:hypothetical protein